jgi:hypothetical protein
MLSYIILGGKWILSLASRTSHNFQGLIITFTDDNDDNDDSEDDNEGIINSMSKKLFGI